MFHKLGEATVKEIKTIGLDLAKNVIQVHGVDVRGSVNRPGYRGGCLV